MSINSLHIRLPTLKACWLLEKASVPAFILYMYLLQLTSSSSGCSSWKWAFWRYFSNPGLR